MTRKLSRREFLTVSAAAGGGMLIAFHLPFAREARAELPKGVVPNAWIRIAPDSTVTIMSAKSEMGQGVMTSLPMIVADEMDADWSRVRVETAPADRVYADPERGAQFTGGSRSVRKHWDQLRHVGAAVREMLVAAAAQRWGVPADACRTDSGTIVNTVDNRRLTYGELAEAALRLPIPEQPRLKDPKTFKLIGKPVKRVDTPEKVAGTAVFGVDVKLPGMLYASVAQCPEFGGRIASFDDTRARAVPGVRDVVKVDEATIAVVANTWWQANRGRELLDVTWEKGALATLSSSGISKAMAADAAKPGLVARNDGDVSAALASGQRTLEAVYETPFLAHACMEPMSCTVDIRIDGCDVWTGTQSQTGTQFTVGKLLDMPPESVNVHTTLLGGGFGRRFEMDFLVQTVKIAKAVGAPVKLIWTREEDTQHDFYRPATWNRLRGSLDAAGNIVAWDHKLVSPSIFARANPSRLGKDGMDPQSIEGAANLPYDIPNLRVDWTRYESGVPVGFWRSVGSSQNAFVTECFLDELAHAVGKDPFAFRRAMLSKHPRHRAVLDMVAVKAGWGSELPKGVFRGIALHESFEGIVAQVAEVSVDRQGAVKVHRVVCAVDCGTVVNPDTVIAQMESGIVYGLSAALYGEITIRNGRVEQGNFDTYPVLRMNEMPAIETYIMPSDAPPGGVGEPSTPVIAPAVCNAIFAATGRRIRSLPIRPGDLVKA
jgi:isoquinoline 1-oxidoreductase beta subunit